MVEGQDAGEPFSLIASSTQKPIFFSDLLL
jgi:hypothetical protein